jgi:hypothetical protein
MEQSLKNFSINKVTPRNDYTMKRNTKRQLRRGHMLEKQTLEKRLVGGLGVTLYSDGVYCSLKEMKTLMSDLDFTLYVFRGTSMTGLSS